MKKNKYTEKDIEKFEEIRGGVIAVQMKLHKLKLYMGSPHQQCSKATALALLMVVEESLWDVPNSGSRETKKPRAYTHKEQAQVREVVETLTLIRRDLQRSFPSRKGTPRQRVQRAILENLLDLAEAELA